MQVTPKPPLSTAPEVQAKTGEKSISLFYLLQHYNKENAAVYKAQKEAKAGNQKGAAKSASGAAPKKAKKKSKPQKDPAPGFAVPGQSVPAGASPVPSQGTDDTPVPYVPRQAVIPPQAPVSPLPQIAPEPPKSADFGDTNYLFETPAEDCETVIMGQEVQSQKLLPHLIRKRNGERISVDKAVFYLGRDAEFNDYAIVDNKYVGHSHCHIVTKDGEYFIVDDNSKNHTLVNGEVISSGVEVKLAHDYSIKLADEEFEFKLY
jgi:hypothetical protein